MASGSSRRKSGSASDRLGPTPSRSRRVIGTSSASLRPKSKVSMRRKCSASIVSRGRLRVPEARLVVAVVHLPLRERLGRRLLAERPAGDVVGRGHEEEEHEEQQEHAQHGREAVEHAAQEVGEDHRILFLDRPHRRREHERRRARAAPTPARSPAGSTRRASRARSGTSMSRYLRVENDMPSGFALCTQPWMRAYDSGWKSSIHGRSRSRMPRISLDEAQPFGPVGRVAHGQEAAVELRIGEVGGVRSARAARALAPEEKEEVLGVGVVGHPPPHEELVGAAAHLVLELVVGSGGDLDVDADAAPGVDEELVAQPTPRAGVRRVEGEVERLAGLRVDAARIARLAQQVPGALEIDLAEGVQIGLLVAEDARAGSRTARRCRGRSGRCP